MDVFNVVALLIALTALLAYLNHRTLRLPTTIGVMGLALCFSLKCHANGLLPDLALRRPRVSRRPPERVRANTRRNGFPL